jgi:hypothetical protein
MHAESLGLSAAAHLIASKLVNLQTCVRTNLEIVFQMDNLPIIQHINGKAKCSHLGAAEAIANVQDVLGGTNSEGCVHGDMVWKEGEKAGRAWGGFFCGYAPRTGEAKCSTVWYNLGSNGKWERQKLRSV